jgi:hypothetical protein
LTGAFNIAGGGTLLITSANTSVVVNDGFSGTTVNLGGAGTWNNTGDIPLSNGAVFNILSTGSLDVQSDRIMGGGPGSTFNNAGLLKKTGVGFGGGNTSISAPFSNTGTVRIDVGTILFSPTYTQTSGATILNGGNLSMGSGTLTLTGGTLSGTGTFTGTVNNTGGVVKPGLSPGTFTISGNYTQGASSSLNIELAGIGAGQFGLLTVSGSATLGGTLNVLSLGGFTPPAGSNYQVATYASHTGDFTTKNLTVSGVLLTEATNATNVTLTAPAAGPPTISFAPTSVPFGNQQVGVASAVTNVQVTNSSSNGATLHITAMNVGGTNSPDFILSAPSGGAAPPCAIGNNPTTLTQGNSCFMGVKFNPSATGARNATLNVADDAAASPQMVPLSGTGTQPSILFAPTSVPFGNQQVGVASAVTNVQVSNNTANGDPLHITAMNVGGANSSDFTLSAPSGGATPACAIGSNPTTLAQGASCFMGISFNPGATGARNATLNVADDAAASPQMVPLSGTGIAAVLSASLSPSPVPFGNQRVNTTGTAVTVTLTNTGTGTVTLAAANAVTITGTNAADFANATGTTCTNGAILTAPSGACVIKLTFKPGATGARTATLSVSDNATASPQTVTLNGTGTAPTASLSTNGVNFGFVPKGTTSATMALTVTNTGTDTLNFAAANAVALSGTNAADFTIIVATTTCNNGTAVPPPPGPGNSCVINLTFKPSTAAAEAATLTLTDDSGGTAGTTQIASLSGTGTAGIASLSTAAVPFGSVPVSTTSSVMNVTLSNTGNGVLQLGNPALSITGANPGDFSFASGTTCMNLNTFGQGGSCVVSLTFTPTTTGARAATLTFTDDSGGTAGATQTVSLTGTGTAASVTLAPSPVNFGNQPINTTSSATAVTLTNSGTASVTLAAANAVTITGTNASDFTVVTVTGTNCANGLVVAATNGSCVIGVTFKPVGTGPRTATLQVTDNASPATQSVALNGTGTVSNASLAPVNVPFGNQRKGTTSGGTDVTVSNTGTATLNIASITLGGTNPTQFVLGAPSSGTACSLTAATPVAAAGNCKFSVKFAPTATGAQAANVTVTDDSGGIAGTTQTVTLSGTGTLPQASAAPNPLPFGNQRKGTTSAALTVTLTNAGTDTLNLAAANAVAISGANAADFKVATGTTCNNSTAVPPAPGPGNSCVVNVMFMPSTTGAEAATLTITDDSGGVAGTTQNVSLTGTGVLPQGGAAPPTLAFGNQPKGVTSGALTATLTNSGSDTLNLAAANAVGISGTNAADFKVATGTTCVNGGAVAPNGGTCVVNVTFTPSTTAAEAGTLTITDDSGGVAGTTQTVALTGTGTTVTVAFSPSPEPFGNQRVGTTSVALTMTLTNSGNGAVTLAAANAVTLSGGNAGDFAITGGTCAASLVLTAAPGPGNTCTVTATFKPSALGSENTTLTVTFQGGTPPATDNLTGTGVFPQATPSPSPVNFNNQVINTTSGAMTLTLTNGGTDVLHLAASNAVVIGGTNPGDFVTAAGTTCTSGATVNPAANCAINLTFTPSALNARTATLTITDDANPTTQVVTLNGSGTNPAPTITSPLVPSSTLAGGSAFVLTINGTNFVTGATVNFGANPALTPTTVTAGQILVTVPAADIATGGTINVTVTNPAPGGGTSAPVTFTINNPLPTITTLSPASATAGGTTFTLTVNGTNFVSTSVVNFNGVAKTTTFVNATQVTAAITAADIAAGGTFPVTVTNAAPGGGTSAPTNFTVNNPVPTITSLAPSSATAGGAAFSLTVNGTGFVTGQSLVKFNGNPKTTTVVSATQVTAPITAADIATAGTFPVTVTNAAPGGGTSAPTNFTVNNPAPTITTLSPSSAIAGGAAFTLTVNGTNFMAASVVNLNGAARTTTFGSATQLTAAITAADIATAGTPSVTVTNPAPGGGTSGGVTFTINNPQPVLSTLSPASAAAGGAAFTLTVNGSKFVNNAVVSFNGTAKTTTFVSATQVTAAISAVDIATAGTFNVIVTNPAPTVGPSAPAPFAVNNPVPTVTSATAGGKTHVAGGTGFTLTVSGTQFVSTSVINFNGKAGPTTFVSATQLTAAIPASDVSTAGNANVTVTNPAPGGGTTAASSFTVDGFTVSGPANTTVKAGQQAMITITVTPTTNGFTNPVTFTVAGLPAHTTAAFSPTSVTPNGAAQTTTLTIMTAARGAAPPSAPVDPPVSPLLRLLPVLWLAAMLTGLYAMQLIRRNPLRRRYVAVVPLALLLVTGAILAGCSGAMMGTPAGPAQLTITATSGSMVQTTPANSVTLTVQ